MKNIKFYNYDEQLMLLKEKGLLISNDIVANYEGDYSFAGKDIYQVFDLPCNILDRLALYFKDNKLPKD